MRRKGAYPGYEREGTLLYRPRTMARIPSAAVYLTAVIAQAPWRTGMEGSANLKFRRVESGRCAERPGGDLAVS